jgi:RND family efflux transporter MFP subunit
MTLDGTVREVAASADQQSRTFAVRVSMPNDPRILLGMTATIKASTDEASPSVSIPLTALAKKDDKPIVWTVDRDAQTVHARDVQLADFTDEGVRVTSGLAPGDIVVTAGTQFMVENLKVKLPDLQGRQSASVETDKSQIVQ